MEQQGDFILLGKHDRTIPEDLQKVTNLKLRIWNSKFDRYEDLASCSNLTELEIMAYRSDSFAPLGCLRSLGRLFIMDFPKVTSFEPLKTLTGLEELTLETLPSGDASGKRKSVESFQPLAPLIKLRVLKLAGVRTLDKDLSPLGGLSDLQVLAIPNFFPQREFAMLSAKLPHLHSSFLAPYLRLEGNLCNKCRSEKVMLSGSDVPNPKVICPTCRRKKFEETVARFEMYRSEKR